MGGKFVAVKWPRHRWALRLDVRHSGYVLCARKVCGAPRTFMNGGSAVHLTPLQTSYLIAPSSYFPLQVRKAFRADTAAGKTLVVADYSQLDLRILAHVTACQSMIAAFVQGGDFHSRMAYGMYDYIQEAVRNGGYDG